MSESTPARRLRRTSIAAAALAGMLGIALFSPDALAQTDRCARLEAQLVAADAGSRSSPAQIGRYDAAVATQRAELDRADHQARSAGCDVRPGSPVCIGLDATRNRMARNLTDLVATRDRMRATAPDMRERGRIEAALDREGCRGTEITTRNLPPPMSERQQGTVNEGVRILGGGYRSREAERPEERYRTVCVRICDGYFFPVSQSTTIAMFGHDEQLCSARCPGTRTELHFQSPGQEPATMLSVASGRPYGSLPTAFSYRDTEFARPAGCGCNSVDGTPARSEGRGWSELGAELRTRSEPEDEKSALPEPSEPVDPADRRVRVVGPTFLPGPEEAIDLQAPAPRSVP
jgi:hypothetical protein